MEVDTLASGGDDGGVERMLDALQVSWVTHGAGGHASCDKLVSAVAPLLLQVTDGVQHAVDDRGSLRVATVAAVLRFVACLDDAAEACPSASVVHGGSRGAATLLLRVLQYGVLAPELAEPAAAAAATLVRLLRTSHAQLAEGVSGQLVDRKSVV